MTEPTAQPSPPLCVSESEELPAALAQQLLGPQVGELILRYVLPFPMLGSLFPASGRGGASAQSALSQGSPKITSAPGFQCFFPVKKNNFFFLFSLFLLFPCRSGIQLDENKDMKALLEKILRERRDDFKVYQFLSSLSGATEG